QIDLREPEMRRVELGIEGNSLLEVGDGLGFAAAEFLRGVELADGARNIGAGVAGIERDGLVEVCGCLGAVLHRRLHAAGGDELAEKSAAKTIRLRRFAIERNRLPGRFSASGGRLGANGPLVAVERGFTEPGVD